MNSAHDSGFSRSDIKIWIGLAIILLTGCLAVMGGQGAAPGPVANLRADAELLAAVVKGDVSGARSAIEAGANPNSSATTNLPPLLQLLRGTNAPITSEHRQCVALLLEKGASQGVVDEHKRTPLICAALLGDLDTVRLLVESGANVTARDSFHKTALLYAVGAHRRDIVAYLGRNGDLQSLPYKPPARKNN